MKVTTHSWSWDDDCRSGFQIDVDGKQTVFRDGEPEDANLCRDFNGVFSIPGMMREAYEAGKRGEPFEFVELDACPDE